MGGFVEGIFGQKSKEPSTRVESPATLTPEQKALLDFLIPVLKGGVETPNTASNLENLSLAALEQMAMQSAGGDGAGEFATNKVKDIASRGPTDFEEFFQTNVQQPTIRDFNRDIIPGIRESFSTRFFGGERVAAEDRAREELVKSLTSSRADLALKTQQNDIQNTLAALGILPTLSNLDQNNALGLLEAGRGQRESLGNESARDIQLALAALGIPAFENIAISTPGRANNPGLLGDFAKLAFAKGIGF